MKILARTAEIVPEAGRQFLDRQMLQQVIAKNACPTMLQQPTPLRPKILPRIEQILASMVA
jgi:hypothetical protein